MWNQTDMRDDKENPVRPGQGAGPGDKRIESGDGRTPNLGRTVIIKGEITGSEDLTLDGQVDGIVNLPDHVLTIGPNAMVQADLNARVVMIFGTVVGKVNAKDKAEVRVGGSLDGFLTAPRVVIQEGAHLGGQVEMPRHPKAATASAAA